MAAPTFTGLQHKAVAGIAEMVVSNNPNVLLTTYSLGSCVGVAVYDPLMRVGGLLHAMLPEAKLDPHKAAQKPAMFVDTGIEALLRGMTNLRARLNQLRVAVAGGSQIMDANGFFNIGKRNSIAVREVLRSYGLVTHAEHVGGLVNRTLYLDVASGEVTVRISGQAEPLTLCKPSTAI